MQLCPSLSSQEEGSGLLVACLTLDKVPLSVPTDKLKIDFKNIILKYQYSNALLNTIVCYDK